MLIVSMLLGGRELTWQSIRWQGLTLHAIPLQDMTQLLVAELLVGVVGVSCAGVWHGWRRWQACCRLHVCIGLLLCICWARLQVLLRSCWLSWLLCIRWVLHWRCMAAALQSGILSVSDGEAPYERPSLQ